MKGMLWDCFDSDLFEPVTMAMSGDDDRGDIMYGGRGEGSKLLIVSFMEQIYEQSTESLPHRRWLPGLGSLST